jgi:hypothetical protein
MKTLINNPIVIDSERSPNIAAFALARLASFRLLVSVNSRSAQPGPFFAFLLLKRRIVAKTSSRTSRRSANFLKGDRHGNLSVHSKGDCCVGDCGNLRPGLLARSETLKLARGRKNHEREQRHA